MQISKSLIISALVAVGLAAPTPGSSSSSAVVDQYFPKSAESDIQRRGYASPYGSRYAEYSCYTTGKSMSFSGAEWEGARQQACSSFTYSKTGTYTNTIYGYGFKFENRGGISPAFGPLDCYDILGRLDRCGNKQGGWFDIWVGSTAGNRGALAYSFTADPVD